MKKKTAKFTRSRKEKKKTNLIREGKKNLKRKSIVLLFMKSYLLSSVFVPFYVLSFFFAFSFSFRFSVEETSQSAQQQNSNSNLYSNFASLTSANSPLGQALRHHHVTLSRLRNSIFGLFFAPSGKRKEKKKEFQRKIHHYVLIFSFRFFSWKKLGT